MPSLTITGTPPFNGDSSCTLAGTDRVEFLVAGLMVASQGWVAMRIKTAAAAADGVHRGLFDWGGAGNSIHLFKRNDAQLILYRKFDPAVIGVSYAADAHLTFVGTWDGSVVKLSLNGANFVSAASTDVFAPGDTTAFIGFSTNSANTAANADYYWFACGSGFLTNGNAATLHGFGDTDPTWAALPGTPTLLWKAESATYQNAPDPAASSKRPKMDLGIGIGI